MAEDQNRESGDREKTHRTEPTTVQPAGGEGLFVPETPSYPGTLLGDPRLNGRGNAPVRAAVMQRMQQTYGNRAVQRFLQLQRTTSTAPLPVQRAGDGGQQPQGGGQDQDKKKEPMAGELPPIKGEPVPVPGGCDDGDLDGGATDSGAGMPVQPLRFNVQLDMGLVALQRDPGPSTAPTAGSGALPRFDTWPKDMPRRTVGQVTVKPSQGGADPTTTAPADPASQSADADRQKAIDAILEKVKANRGGINERFMRLASAKGYMYTAGQEAQSGSGANQQQAGEYEQWRKSSDATPDAVKKNPDDPLVKAQVELWQDIGGEGDPSSMNTWDMMNVTYGRGFAAGGQLQQVMQILFKSDPDAAKIFFDAGIAMEGGQFLVVNLDSKLAELNDSAERVIQVDRKLVSLFVNLAQSKEHRKAVVNAQWETFIKNTGNMPPEVVGWGDRKARAVAGHNIHGGGFSWGNFKGDGGSLKRVVATIGYKLGAPAPNGTTWVPGHVTKARLQQLAHGWAMEALEKKPYKVVEQQPEEPNSTPNTPEGPHSTAQGEPGHIYFEIPGQANSWFELIP
ncbi:MAG: hypothetical protein M3328_04310 [Chloroflexota bacterium]|nr:hypothetical protein [Chloroflexota bacterium]